MSSRFGWFVLLVAFVHAERTEAQVWTSGRSTYYRSAGGAVARYSTPFVPGYTSGRLSSGRPTEFTWWSVSDGYSYGPQTGLPWRAEGGNRQRVRTPNVQEGASAVAHSRAFRPSRRSLDYKRELPPSVRERLLARQQRQEAAIQAASSKQRVRSRGTRSDARSKPTD